MENSIGVQVVSIINDRIHGHFINSHGRLNEYIVQFTGPAYKALSRLKMSNSIDTRVIDFLYDRADVFMIVMIERGDSIEDDFFKVIPFTNK